MDKNEQFTPDEERRSKIRSLCIQAKGMTISVERNTKSLDEVIWTEVPWIYWPIFSGLSSRTKSIFSRMKEFYQCISTSCSTENNHSGSRRNKFIEDSLKGIA